MNIEFLEKVKHDGHTYNKGVIDPEFDNAVGAYFCECGWAKDLDEKIATGDREKAHEVTLDVDNVAQGTKATNVEA